MRVKTIEDVFDEEDIIHIYGHVQKALKDVGPDSEKGEFFFNAKDVGYFAVFGFQNEKVCDTIHNFAEMGSGYKLEKDFQMHFARYTSETGAKPRLRPHYDEMLTADTVTLSIQLAKNTDWLLYVGTEALSLNMNEMAIFSGSHQIHWRPKKEFLLQDFYDVMVCQFTIIGGNKLPEGHQEHMWEIRKPFIDLYGSVED
jgi:hypothetical protein